MLSLSKRPVVVRKIILVRMFEMSIFGEKAQVGPFCNHTGINELTGTTRTNKLTGITDFVFKNFANTVI